MDIEENQNPEIHIEQSKNPETNFEDRQNPEKDIENNQNPEMDFEKNKKPEMDSQERQSTEMDFEKSENPETESEERQNPEMDFEENENPETESEERKNPERETESDLKSMEFCDEASPRGVLEIPVSGTESDQSSSTSSSSSLGEKTTTGRSQGQRGQWKNVLELLKRKSARRFSTMPFLAASYEMSRRNLRRKLARIRSAEEGRVVDCEGFMAAKPSWRSFGYAELAAATANFSPGKVDTSIESKLENFTDNLIGRGGQAEVYKGCFSDGQIVAVKRLIKKEKENEERIGDFLSELGIIAHIDHPNAARLLGFGVDGGSEGLEWKIRFKVAIGVAEGLQYLHHNCQRRIIHRDIKASNILLTQDYEAQISDFGLAKWLPEKWTHHVVFPIEGTFGYLAPEYFMHGIIDEKTDVFAYGVLLLELITGRRAVDSSQQSLVIWAKPMLDMNNFRELADARLGEGFDIIEMKRVMLTASMCIHHQSSRRPYMNRVVQLLKAEDGYQELKPKSTALRSVMLDACDLEDYTCSTYLNDLNRHRQLVME
ncbi:Receptor-like cytosolic serine/threonine-protein kinase RBK1 [Morus notabilis]|uniref:non-specific serine/threonine protein kinase n=1 Tax=Morus notabilis TaxID=981085 RepID=W9SKT9_9ROSA|nr:Receptor-like cytosolic serine/threonine-protein kinase RBK1 [Morus notabilis]